MNLIKKYCFGLGLVVFLFFLACKKEEKPIKLSVNNRLTENEIMNRVRSWHDEMMRLSEAGIPAYLEFNIPSPNGANIF